MSDVKIDGVQTNLVTEFANNPERFAEIVEQNFEMIRELLKDGQDVNGTFSVLGPPPQTFTIHHGLVIEITSP